MAKKKSVKKSDGFAEFNRALGGLQALIKQQIAIQLYLGGATQDEIANNLSISKGDANKMVRGIKKATTTKPDSIKAKKIPRKISNRKKITKPEIQTAQEVEVQASQVDAIQTSQEVQN